MQVQASPETPGVLEQDTLFSALILVQPRKTHPDMTEKLMKGAQRINMNKIIYYATDVDKFLTRHFFTVT